MVLILQSHHCDAANDFRLDCGRASPFARIVGSRTSPDAESVILAIASFEAVRVAIVIDALRAASCLNDIRRYGEA